MAFFSLYWLQGQIQIAYSVLQYIHESFALAIWFGYYKWFHRSFASNALTDKPKSTRKYLITKPFTCSALSPSVLCKTVRVQSRARWVFSFCAIVSCSFSVVSANISWKSKEMKGFKRIRDYQYFYTILS